MTNAKKDANYVSTQLGVQLDDLTTPIPIVVDQSNNRLLVTSITTNELLPTDGNNASLVLAYDGGNLVTITKTIGATSYQKTLSYTGTDLTGVSAWMEL